MRSIPCAITIKSMSPLLCTMSDLEVHKKKFVEILASRLKAVATKDDIYDFMVGSTSKAIFNQVIDSLLDEGSIIAVTYDPTIDMKHGYRLTANGIKKYSVEQIADSAPKSGYVSQDKHKDDVLIVQHTQYTSSTVGLSLTPEERRAQDAKVRRQFRYCFVVILIAAILIVIAIM